MDGVDGIVSSPEELSEIIEDKIFEKFKQTNPKYKAQVRSRVFNLRDKKNPSLRENVLCGVIRPEKLAVMTSEEMASDEVCILLQLNIMITNLPIKYRLNAICC